MKAVYWLIASFITLSGLGTMAVGASLMKKDQKNTQYISSKESYEGIRNLDLDLGSEDLHVIAIEDTNVCTVELCEVPEQVKVAQEGDTLRIYVEPNNAFQMFDFDNTQNRVNVFVPADLFDSVEINNGSGDVEVLNVLADYMDAKAGSGSVYIDGATSRVGNVKSGSGGIGIVNTTFTEESELHTGSGGISCEEFTGNKVEAESGSGSIFFLNSTVGKTKAKSGSGGVLMTDQTLTDDIECTSGSGDIEITVCGDQADYVLDVTLGSGDPNFEGIGGKKNADPHTIKIKSGSGDASVHFVSAGEAVEEVEIEE